MDELRLRAPGSKSLTQRALILAALTPGESVLVDALDSDDTRHLRGALRELGVSIDDSSSKSWVVRGGSLKPPSLTIWCGDGGTVLRFLAPLSLLIDGELFLDGSDRLAERPLDPLVAALTRLGVKVRSMTTARALPLSFRAGPREGGRGRVQVDSTASSQFLSGVLMIAPRLPGGLDIEVSGGVSRPYVDMTLGLMQAHGAKVSRESESLISVAPGEYLPGRYEIEGDWSSAAFMLAAGFITGRTVAFENVSRRSLQGDRAIAGFLEELATPRPHTFNLEDVPDLLPPLAAAAAFASHPTEIRGVAHARLKESDRLSVLARGFAKAGLLVQELPDGLRLLPASRPLRAVALSPHGDHRMAMAFGLLSLKDPAVTVSTPECVNKSFPGFWQELQRFKRPR